MIIQNNLAAARAYAPYSTNLRNLAASSQRLSSGERFASPSDSAGQLGVADKMRANMNATRSILTGVQNVIGYTATQDAILSQVSDILSRMAELAGASVDTTKTAGDRNTLNSEYRALAIEVKELGTKSKYNGTSLFGTAQSIHIGVTNTEVIALASIDLSNFGITLSGLTISTSAAASTFLGALSTRLQTLASMRNTARTNNARLERSLSFMQSYIDNLGNAESAIRDVDLAVETGEFTKMQMLVTSGQAILAQANSLVQSAQRFLQFQ